MADDTYRRYDSGRYDGVDKDKKIEDKPFNEEKGKVLQRIEKEAKPANDAGKLRDKTKKKMEELGI